jgi:hypothetical protein
MSVSNSRIASGLWVRRLPCDYQGERHIEIVEPCMFEMA